MAQPQDEDQEMIDPLLCLFQIFGENSTDSSDEWTHRRHRLLNTPGYIVIPSVLTHEECSYAIDRIWEFICDTTYGEVRRDDPTTWSVLWPKSTFENVSDDIDNYHFLSNGAGYLLSNVHEILADRVFALLFGTRELHSSKEGFLFRSTSLDKSTIFPNTRQQDATPQVSMSCSPNSIKNLTNKPYVRAMVALEDQYGGASFVCCPKSFTKQLPIDVQKCRTDKLDFFNNPVHFSKSDEMNYVERESVSLKKGDILIWRSDLVYSIVDPWLFPGFRSSPQPSPRSTAAMFCSMQPARLTPDAITPMKMEAYKQRQTGSYCVDVEQWFMSPSDAMQRIRTRQFFRRGPPLVTMRQAQLYGLVPYKNKTFLEDEHCAEMHRALIRGVRFVDADILSANAPFLSSGGPEYNKMNGAHLVHLTTKDPTDMVGQDKYLGGMSSPCGKFVYGVPGSAKRVLRIRISDGQMDLIGPTYEGKFKWLRGVDVTASAMKHDPRYPDGCCLALPCNSASVLKINPATNNVYSFGEDILKGCGSDRWHYHGGNIASNGWLYAIPANASRVVKIHPVTDEVVFIGPTLTGGQKWFGGITGSDGCIYGIPHNEQTVLKINPIDDTISLLVLDSGEPLPAGQWKWHGGLRAGDKIYGFPNNADNVLVIHCRENRVYTLNGGGEILRSGRHRIPQDDRYKYLGGATTLDQRYAYLFPCDAERVLRIDCLTDELRLIGPLLLEGENKFQNGFVGQDGCVYGIPQRASGVLQIIPGSLMSSAKHSGPLCCARECHDDHVDMLDCGPDFIGVKDKFEGGVLGPDGCIYCIPLRSKICIKIVPGKPLIHSI